MLQFDQIVTVIGATRTGLATAGMIAKHCKSVGVFVTDPNADLVKKCSDNAIPFYEPGLCDLIKENKGKSLFFTSGLNEAVSLSEIVFVCTDGSGAVGSGVPFEPDKYHVFARGKSVQQTEMEHSARLISESAAPKKIVVDRSRAPNRTSQVLKSILGTKSYQIVSNPAVYTYGDCVKDTEHPDRVLVAGDDVDSVNSVVGLYKQWVPARVIQTTKAWHAELATLMALCLEAQRVVSMNSLYSLCEKCNVPGKDIGKMMNEPLPSLGFGDKHLTKAVLYLIHLLRFFGFTDNALYWESVLSLNQTHIERLYHFVMEKMTYTVEAKKIVLYGVSTCVNSDELVGSPALSLLKRLITAKVYVTVCDPHCTSEQISSATKGLTDTPKVDDYLTIGKSVVGDVKGAHALFVMTPLGGVNYEDIYNSMKHPSYLFDATATVDTQALEKIGFSVFRVGG